ncbi:hypothetical protein [Nocardioides sp. SYSU D00038]|uniref:hypothetical protein n=1 Tax=Nocardioides sp. SYSU D00038 TaxID=2812554 RepID=UPI00196832D6|nr:hypothetical protein [Nocardioides sp. SYSU D00038]
MSKKSDLITCILATGTDLAEPALRRKTIGDLEALLADLTCGGCDNGDHCGACECCTEPEPCPEHPAYDADYCPACGTTTPISERAPGQPVEAASRAEEPAAADSPAEPVEQPEKVADAVRDWRGNYNTVFAPAAKMIATGTDGVDAWTVNVSTMLRQTHIAGPGAAGLSASLSETETQALAALKAWQKTLDRKEATDMEKFNQNRSFLAGYLGAVVREVTGAKKAPVVPFAKDMDRAIRPEALKAGAAARKASA